MLCNFIDIKFKNRQKLIYGNRNRKNGDGKNWKEKQEYILE